MKTLNELSKEDIDKAFDNQMQNESVANDVVIIEGIPFKNVHMPLNDYARSIGATPYEQTTISKI